MAIYWSDPCREESDGGDVSAIIHGLTKRAAGGARETSPEWRIYNAMKNRCMNPKTPRFGDYGGRGISVCGRWLSGDGVRSGVECFIADMGCRPSDKHTLERIGNDLGYSPQNCRWATKAEQNRNTRANRIVSIDGEEMPLITAVERFSSVRYQTVAMRLFRGWPDALAILSPHGFKREGA